MQVVSNDNIKLEDFSMEVPCKISEDSKIYLAKASGPMIYFNSSMTYSNKEVNFDENFNNIRDKITEHFQKLCSEKSSEWFKGKHFSFEKIKSATQTQVVLGKIFDEDKRPVKLENFADGSYNGIVIINFEGFYFENKTINSKWTAKQIKIDKQIYDPEYMELSDNIVKIEEETEEDELEFSELLS